jgi:hypothetical protein
MTTEVFDEWKRHERDFARKWRIGMIARKKLRVGPVDSRDDLRQAVRNSGLAEEQEAALEKDLHVLEAALQTDCGIASLDETLRELVEASQAMRACARGLDWVNPEREDDAVQWLEDGARAGSRPLVRQVRKPA